jgi:hypothetical protein
MYVEQLMQLNMLTSSGNVFAIRLKMTMMTMMMMTMMETAVRGETFCKQVVQPLGYACIEYTVVAKIHLYFHPYMIIISPS